MLSAFSSTLGETSLPNLKSAVSVCLDFCTFNAGKLFPALEKVHNVAFEFSDISGFDIPIINVTGELEVLYNSNISSVNLSDLKQVHGNLRFVGRGEIQKVNLSSLTSAKKIEIITNITSLDLASNLTWKEESEFRVLNFCEDYHSKFTTAGLKFKTHKDCETRCDRQITLTPENYPEIMDCKVARGLTLDGNLFHGPVDLPNLQELVESLELVNFPHDVRFPSLKKVGEIIYLIGNSNLAVTSFSDLEASSLEVLSSTSQQALEFNNLRLNNELVITNSSLAMISGINAKVLKKITILNNPNLWELRLPNLSYVHNMILVENPQLLYLEKTFPNLGKVAKSLHVEKSNIVNLKLSVESI
ncbi:hypothetical protein DSO57_1017711 [Entomophthora muscae]|uniref:Uncharacterized protein n=1 Tax=Entomophthora muscae TaxID=34485 RepID=A0ACC2ST82_9FUNG|nr:hypothetical protein DSO57_1017711 [Entomophthora muscae]